MNDLDKAYAGLLHVGLLAQRDALSAKNFPLGRELAEFLHNMPSLLGETNCERHRYFWNSECEHFCTWVAANETDPVRAQLLRLFKPWVKQLVAAYPTDFADWSVEHPLFASASAVST